MKKSSGRTTWTVREIIGEKKAKEIESKFKKLSEDKR